MLQNSTSIHLATSPQRPLLRPQRTLEDDPEHHGPFAEGHAGCGDATISPARAGPWLRRCRSSREMSPKKPLQHPPAQIKGRDQQTGRVSQSTMGPAKLFRIVTGNGKNLTLSIDYVKMIGNPFLL